MEEKEKLPNKLCGFRLRKKKVARKLQYEKWYAYKRIGSKLHWIYLGKTSEGAEEKIKAYLARMETALPLFDAIEKKLPNKMSLEDKRKQLIQSIARVIETAKETYALLEKFVPGLENTAPYLESMFIEIDKATLQIEALINSKVESNIKC